MKSGEGWQVPHTGVSPKARVQRYKYLYSEGEKDKETPGDGERRSAPLGDVTQQWGDSESDCSEGQWLQRGFITTEI